MSNEQFASTLNGVVNNVSVDGSGNIVRNWTSSGSFRGLIGQHGFLRVTGAMRNRPDCLSVLPSLGPVPVRNANGSLPTD